MTDETKTLPETGRRFVSDLLAIEVNTIVTDYGLTARDMPPAPIAALDIAGKYHYFLVNLAKAMGVPLPELESVKAEDRNNSDDFFWLLSRSEKALRESPGFRAFEPGEGPFSSYQAKMKRIRDATAEIAMIIERSITATKDKAERAERDIIWSRTRLQFASNDEGCATKARLLEVDPNDLAFIRKMWEIGTDEIAIQTVVQLSGDAVTRIVRDKGEVDMQALHHLHLAQVKTGVETWLSVAELISKLVSGLAQAIGQGLGFRKRD